MPTFAAPICQTRSALAQISRMPGWREPICTASIFAAQIWSLLRCRERTSPAVTGKCWLRHPGTAPRRRKEIRESTDEAPASSPAKDKFRCHLYGPGAGGFVRERIGPKRASGSLRGFLFRLQTGLGIGVLGARRHSETAQAYV